MALFQHCMVSVMRLGETRSIPLGRLCALYSSLRGTASDTISSLPMTDAASDPLDPLPAWRSSSDSCSDADDNR